MQAAELLPAVLQLPAADCLWRAAMATIKAMKGHATQPGASRGAMRRFRSRRPYAA